MSSDETSAHSAYSSSGRAYKPVDRLITQDTHSLDRQKQKEAAKKRKQKSTALAPERRDARNANQRVEHLSPQRREAKNANRRVEHLSPQRRDARNANQRVEHVSPQRRETLNANKRQRRSVNSNDADADGETSDDGAVNRDAA